ncbi:RING-H2 finger protein ATL43 [Zea mays]|jgi:hypothetical protein|nr:RING-H2 finger protein ATL3C [Zea mays]PWZ29876.1 RING-H2 finger protein ATL43 [Zea mays]
MEALGTTGIGSSLTAERSIQAYATGIEFFPRQTTTSGERGFALHLRCYVTLIVNIGNGRPNRVFMYRRRDADTSCLALPDDEDGVRDVLRGLLKSTLPLQRLGLTDREWESILPQEKVSLLVDPVLRARHAAAEILLAVEMHVCHDAAQILMTTCKESSDIDGGSGAVGGDAEAECSICLVALRESEAVELSACAHAFHRHCISEWFGRKSTCPLCRDDVAKYLDPELQQYFDGDMDAHYFANFDDDALQQYLANFDDDDPALDQFYLANFDDDAM